MFKYYERVRYIGIDSNVGTEGVVINSNHNVSTVAFIENFTVTFVQNSKLESIGGRDIPPVSNFTSKDMPRKFV